VSQGVTTIVVGQDGGQHHPLAEFFARLEGSPVAVNAASYAGHSDLQSMVMGEDYRRHATPGEVERMAALLRTEMEAGAPGLPPIRRRRRPPQTAHFPRPRRLARIRLWR
jgi:N-acyl-D-amino-acid deacylase